MQHRHAFTFDGVGNRLVPVTDGARTTFTFDAANQLNESVPSTGSTPAGS
jgi:hypothetical protein